MVTAVTLGFWLLLVGTFSGASSVAVAMPANEPQQSPQDLLGAIEGLKRPAILGLIDDPQALLATNEDGNTPLHLAVAMHDGLLVELLLAYGADPLALNNAGLTPVQLMGSWPRHTRWLLEARRQVTDAFIDHHDQPEPTSTQRRAQARFFFAARLGNIEAARLALRSGADPNATQSNLEQTVLHLYQQPQMIPEFIAMGVDINRKDRRGVSPLTHALNNGRYSSVKALLEAGAEPAVTADPSDLALAARSSDADASGLVRLLLDAGAPVRQLEWMTAMRSRNHKTVRLLLLHEGAFDPESDEGELRIAEAIKLGGDPVTSALRKEPSIAAYMDTRAKRNAADREGTLEAYGKWLAPHGFVLSVLMAVFALVASLPAMTVSRRRFTHLLLVGMCTAAMTHLFAFTTVIQSGLSEFRFFGERAPGLRYFLYVLLDGIAFATGLGVGAIVWQVSGERRPRWTLLVPACAVFFGAVFVLIAHNAGRIDWPTSAYQKLTGYDDYIAEQEQTEARKRAARKAAQKKANQKFASEPHVPLFTAIKKKDPTAVRAALATGLPVDSRNRKGQTALSYAMNSPSRLELIPVLLEAGADPRTANEREIQPIHALLMGGAGAHTLEILNLLLSAGADVNATTSDGNTPLCLVARVHRSARSEEIKALLLARGAKLKFSDRCAPEMYAEDPRVLQQIEATHADLNARQPFKPLNDDFGPYGAPPLWQAAYDRDLERARLLLDLGADIESRDNKRGMTPLQAAVDRSRYAADKGRPIIALLLAHGANPEAVAWDGTTLAELDDNGLVSSLRQ